MRLRSIVQSMGLRKNISFLPAYWIAPVAAILLSEPVCAEEPEITPCHRRGTSLVVLTQERRLYLCDDGKIAGDFSARIASSGVGKTKQGDQKTPLGTYGLGSPRFSKKYGTFVPIGYPTEAQKAKGFSGGDVAIHEPHRVLAWVGRLNNLFDSTDGCVGIATDDEMRVISDWVKRKRPKQIHILQAPRAEEKQ